ncbi:MAG: aryldialkylphosphatase [SAR202 cluster bacterium]|nr:aryldialkylphosphatase [SAR202 cluster bacterium]
MTSPRTGKIQTVLGLIEPSELGVTLSHEHLVFDFSPNFVEPEEPELKALARAPISLSNLGWLQYNWRSSLDNMTFLDQKAASEEVSRFAKAGGRSIVDTTSIGIGRDPGALVYISKATGVNIVMGAGYYVAGSHPKDMSKRSEDQITREIVADVTKGVGATGVRAGIIGEIGCSWPWEANERKAVRAAGRAQSETGAALAIHPGRSEEAPFQIIDELKSVGADISRTVMCHVCRTMYNRDKLLRLAETGIVLEWDLFGHEDTHYPFNEAPTPSDLQRIEQIKWVLDHGFEDQVLISHDICTKQRLARYGGHGFTHLTKYVTLRMERVGITEGQIDKMIQQTPRRVLAFA